MVIMGYAIVTIVYFSAYSEMGHERCLQIVSVLLNWRNRLLHYLRAMLPTKRLTAKSSHIFSGPKTESRKVNISRLLSVKR